MEVPDNQKPQSEPQYIITMTSVQTFYISVEPEENYHILKTDLMNKWMNTLRLNLIV